MKKKRAIIVILIVGIVLVSLCIGRLLFMKETLLDPKNPTRVTVWHYYNGVQMSAFDSMVDDFNRTKGHEMGVFVEAFSQGSVDDLINKVFDTMNGVAGSATLPDMFLAYPDSAYELILRDKLVDLSGYMTQEDINEYVPEFWREGTINEKPYVMPIAKSTELVCIDELAWMRYAQAAGIERTLEECFATWEDVAQTAKDYYEYTDALTPDAPYDGAALFGIDSLSNYMLVGMKQMGVDFSRNEEGKGVLHYDEAVLRRLWDVYMGSMARGYFASEGRFGSDDVKMGTLMGYIGSSAGVGYFPDVITLEDASQREAKLKAMPIPVFQGGEKYVVQQGAGMVGVKSDASREYASIMFIKWLTETERNINFAMDAAYMPVKVEAINGEKMDEILDEMSKNGSPVQISTSRIFRVVVDQLREYELYYSIPFTNSTSIRWLFDDMKKQAVAMRAWVIQQTLNGMEYEEAVEQACGDEAFYDWLDQLKADASLILETA